jgi:hypothetical protein
MPEVQCSSKSLTELEALTRSTMARILELSSDSFDLVIER